MDTMQIVVLVFGAVILALFLAGLLVMWVRKCGSNNCDSNDEVDEPYHVTKNAAYKTEFIKKDHEDGSQTMVLQLAEQEQKNEKENGAEKMTENCPELEKKINELKAQLEELEAEKKAAEDAAAKKAAAKEMYDLFKEFEEEKYKANEDDLAEIEARKRAKEFDEGVAKIYARIKELYGDEIAQLCTGKQELTIGELIELVDAHPELLEIFIEQYRNKCINEKVEPVIKTVTRIASEHYDEEIRKRKQEYSDSVDGDICKELCPGKKADDQPADVPDDQPAQQ